MEKEMLKKFIKKTSLVIEGIEDDSSQNMKIVKITLAEPQTVTGTQITDLGAPIGVTDAQTCYITGDIEDPEKETSDEGEPYDYPVFVKGLEEIEGKLQYNGSLKLDVSKPGFRMRNNTLEQTKPAKLWVVSVNFSKRGGQLIAARRNAVTAAMQQTFGGLLKAAQGTAKTALQPVVVKE